MKYNCGCAYANEFIVFAKGCVCWQEDEVDGQFVRYERSILNNI
jgi:hypothetical protein